MSELYMMVTVSDRNQSRRFLSFYKDFGISVVMTTMGKGTAASEILSSIGLEAAEKALQFYDKRLSIRCQYPRAEGRDPRKDKLVQRESSPEDWAWILLEKV